MTPAFAYRRSLLDHLTLNLQLCPSILAAWEGGSAANAAVDELSDIDLNLLVAGDADAVFPLVEKSLRSASEIIRTWNEPKSLWPDLTQKVYFLADAPKHFFVDVAAFPDTAPEIFEEFMQTERHGQPVILFDIVGRIVSRPTDRRALLQKQQKRLQEIEEAYPVYRTTTFKALERGQTVESFHYYQAGMVRPLVEVLGIVHRPFQFDFGYRYLKRSLPGEIFRQLEPLLFVPDLATLRARVAAVDEMFNATLPAAKAAVANPKG